jgi:hypothetical protein
VSICEFGLESRISPDGDVVDVDSEIRGIRADIAEFQINFVSGCG